MRERRYQWEFDYAGPPSDAWKIIADTNRLNQHLGLPSVEKKNSIMQFSAYGIRMQWEETPFSWVYPHYYSVIRTYTKGPISTMRVRCDLTPVLQGTKITYTVELTPRNHVGVLATALQMRSTQKQIAALLSSTKKELVQELTNANNSDGNKNNTINNNAKNKISNTKKESITFASGGKNRAQTIAASLIKQGLSQEHVQKLLNAILTADDASLAALRPYELADAWHASRREILTLCLHATRAGLLDLQWRILCPLCRGAAAQSTHLQDINMHAHCDSCQVAITVDFERAVELTFTPNPSIRTITARTYCVGGPQVTPHIIAQHTIAPHTSHVVQLHVPTGSYRIRAPNVVAYVHAKPKGKQTSITVDEQIKKRQEITTHNNITITYHNPTEKEKTFVVENTAWIDTATTATDVISLQIFRDLFAKEVLRPGEKVSVGTVTILFTDLKGSTQLYRKIGDAPAFGRVLNHFEVLQKEIASEGGAVVKTIGDAVMAVFLHPASALNAMLRAQDILAHPPDNMLPLLLKAGIHQGPCIAVTLNDRLDYFGSTVNIAARLEGLSSGVDIILSNSAFNDAGVQDILTHHIRATQFSTLLKGFEEEKFTLWRCTKNITNVSDKKEKRKLRK